MCRDECAVNCAFSFAANEADPDLFSRTAVRSGTFIAAAAFLHRARV
jgi:hypothetical protein